MKNINSSPGIHPINRPENTIDSEKRRKGSGCETEFLDLLYSKVNVFFTSLSFYLIILLFVQQLSLNYHSLGNKLPKALRSN